MDSRDREILWHIGLHRVSIRRVIERKFLDGGNSGNALLALRKKGLLDFAGKLRGNIACYKLTSAGRGRLGLTTPDSMGAQALQTALGMLWFCHFEGKAWRPDTAPRRQPTWRLKELFGSDAPSGAHCIEAAGEKSRLFNIYVPGPEVEVSRIVREAEERLQRANRVPVLRDWIASRNYGFAILLDTPSKLSEVKRSLSEGKKLQHEAYIRAEYCPSMDSFSEVLNAV